MTEEQRIVGEPIELHEQRKQLEALWWAGALIWSGLVFAADSLGYLPAIGEAGPWSWAFLGAGLFSLLLNFYAYLGEDRPNPRSFDWVWGSGLALIGLAGFASIDLLWPLILVIAGGAILFGQVLRR